MNYQLIGGMLVPGGIAEKQRLLCNEIKQYRCSSSLRTNPLILQNFANASGNAPDFLDRCKQALVQKKPSMMPAALKQYFIPQWEADRRHPLNPEKKSN